MLSLCACCSVSIYYIITLPIGYKTFTCRLFVRLCFSSSSSSVIHFSLEASLIYSASTCRNNSQPRANTSCSRLVSFAWVNWAQFFPKPCSASARSSWSHHLLRREQCSYFSRLLASKIRRDYPSSPRRLSSSAMVFAANRSILWLHRPRSEWEDSVYLSFYSNHVLLHREILNRIAGRGDVALVVVEEYNPRCRWRCDWFC